MMNFTNKINLIESSKENTLSRNKVMFKKNGVTANYKGSSRIVAGKRNYQAIVSPITTKKEQLSPMTKYPMMEHSMNIQFESRCSSSKKLPFLLDTLNVTNVAVPLTDAEPPSPSSLPSPPKCWFRETTRSKRCCMDVTQSLITHLASSGILATA